MAGTDSRFDATKFRTSIKFAMHMGLPGSTQEQITWQWTKERTFNNPDSGGDPFVWSAGHVTSEVDITDMIVDCAVKFTAPAGTRVGGTGIGIIDLSTVDVTFLDTDWNALIAHGGRFPEKARIDGDEYTVQIVEPPVGLFDVTVYTVRLQSTDES